MDKSIRLKIASALISSGFNAEKVLNLIRYPKCDSIRYVADAVQEIEVKVFSESSSMTYTLSSAGQGRKLKPKPFPLLDYIQQSGNNVYQFFFSDGSQTKILAKGNLSIPSAPQWPEIDFLKPKYPVPA